MSFIKNKIFIVGLLAFFLLAFEGNVFADKSSREDVLHVGKTLPDALLSRYGKPDVSLDSLKGKIKIISVVPQLNTPTCDEQTHLFSETNGGLDEHLDILTISTNSAEGQFKFAKKANIDNLIFLSDAPNYDFGKKTGLLRESFNFLKRTVLVADKDNVIRYVDFVPDGGLPNIERALHEAKKILNEAKS
jgi:thioredoxin-dependent peroxiredoxin